jgi:hypothetical protein
MNRRKPTYFRNSLDLRDKVQVKVLRKRLKLSDEQFASIVRKSGNSISAITKEAARATSAGPSNFYPLSNSTGHRSPIVECPGASLHQRRLARFSP